MRHLTKFQFMLLKLYRTTARFTSALNKCSSNLCVPGRNFRAMTSSPNAYSAISPEKWFQVENKRNQPESCDASDELYDKEVSSPLVNASTKYRSKRRNKIDLGAEHELRSEEEVSISLHSPTHFVKRCEPFRSLKSQKTRPKYVKRMKSLNFTNSVDVDNPFDICFSEPLEQDFLDSCFYERNWGKQIETEHFLEENDQVLRPGMVLLKNYLSLDIQVDIVKRCRKWGLSPGGFYRPGYRNGAKLRLYMMCLGLDWNPETAYQERRPLDGAVPPSIPYEFTSLVTNAIDDSHTLIERHSKATNVEDILPRMSPDVCIVNFYSCAGRLGLHQDRDESKKSLLNGLPVISLSVGDSAEFLYGEKRDVNEAEKVLLKSGDVLIFGGESRHIFHGVTSIIPNTAPDELLERSKLQPGRLNLTFRKC